jgi:hypothetical protein
MDILNGLSAGSGILANGAYVLNTLANLAAFVLSLIP